MAKFITLTQKCMDGTHLPCFVNPEEISAVWTGGDKDYGAVISVKSNSLLICVKEITTTVMALIHASEAKAD